MFKDPQNKEGISLHSEVDASPYYRIEDYLPGAIGGIQNSSKYDFSRYKNVASFF